MPRYNTQHLLRTLEASIGQESAHIELKWMKLALSSAPPHRDPALPPIPDLPTMVARRARGEPLQYILGTQPFGPLHLRTRPPVLIPRAETEHWALRLSQTLAPSPRMPVRVLDICTGSGCIPLLLCKKWAPGSTYAVGIDIAPAALELAAENAAVCGVSTVPPPINDSNRGEALQNVFTPLRGDVRDPVNLATALPLRPFNVVTANPPYITREDYEALPPSVKDFEDPAALIGDHPGTPERGGLTFYYDIARLLRQKGVLSEGALVALEVGDGQAREVEKIVRSETQLGTTEVWMDPWGKERVVFARGA
ncbi:hypothetical protein EW146_g5290 [Bondarzewia mesenterica]|uniref:Methyltransferase domain-containing protein n=1 Tax=Bondarzewia mesenterica TaxID=1095465 RepID=A0A4V3XEV8_9AGAM|nr:hypothetical protein EW146_g5290 [Bondarzewia mesenterica]